MDYDQISALVVFAFVMSVTPGPNNLMLLASGANFGWRRTLPHMLGIAVGFVILTVMVGTGLMQLFQMYPMVYTALKAASVAYLVFLAYKIATAAAPKAAGPTSKPMGFLQAALFQWVNPKAWAMGMSGISAFAPLDSGLAGVVTVAVIFGAVNFPSINIWAFLGTQLRRLLNVRWKLRLFNGVAALLLLSSLYPILWG